MVSPQKTVTSIIKLYKNTKKAIVLSLNDGDTDFFDNVAGILQEDSLAPFPFI